MRTRSQSREQRPPPPEGPPVVIEPLRIEYPFQEDPTVEPMADTRTMAQLLQAPTEGYEDAILIPEIVANNFELRHGLINLVQNKQFFGHDKEDPHAHIRYFNKITSTMRVPNVPIATIKLMLFPFSIEGAARIWLEKEPPRSIQTWGGQGGGWRGSDQGWQRRRVRGRGPRGGGGSGQRVEGGGCRHVVHIERQSYVFITTVC
ncbi:hypothetical protein Tco_0383417 [Tanacetum coccineum]